MADVHLRGIIGLGNPGEDYQFTRHNAGFLFCRALARRARIRRKRTIPDLMKVWTIEFLDTPLFIVFPLTYMNRSGESVYEFLQRYDIRPEEILIVYDDIDLRLGEIRLRKSGSSGGHKGLGDILHRLNTENIPRLRLGIGPVPAQMSVADYVLTPFQEDEWPIFEGMVERGIEALRTVIREGFEKAMSLYNVRLHWSNQEQAQQIL